MRYSSIVSNTLLRVLQINPDRNQRPENMLHSWWNAPLNCKWIIDESAAMFKRAQSIKHFFSIFHQPIFQFPSQRIIMWIRFHSVPQFIRNLFVEMHRNPRNSLRFSWNLPLSIWNFWRFVTILKRWSVGGGFFWNAWRFFWDLLCFQICNASRHRVKFFLKFFRFSNIYGLILIFVWRICWLRFV